MADQKFPVAINRGRLDKAVFGGPYPDVNLGGATSAVINLPVTPNGVWHARVFYTPAEGYESVKVIPTVSHNLDDPGRSFHTTGRQGAQIDVQIPTVAPIIPQWSEPVIGAGFVDLSWSPVQENTSYVVQHVFEGNAQYYETLDNSMRVIVGPGYHEFMVKAVRLDTMSPFSELLGFHVKATGEDQLLIFLYDLKQIVEERIESIEHNKSIVTA